MLHRCGDVGKLRSLAGITGDLLDAGDHGTDLTERVQRRGGLCWQVQFVHASKQPFDEAIKFLPTDQRQFNKPGSCFGNAGPDQAERIAAPLVSCQAVPEAVDKNPDQFVDGIKAFEFGKLPAPQPPYGLEGRDRQAGRSDAPKKSRPDFMEWNRASVSREKRLDCLLVSRDRRSRRLLHRSPLFGMNLIRSFHARLGVETTVHTNGADPPMIIAISMPERLDSKPAVTYIGNMLHPQRYSHSEAFGENIRKLREQRMESDQTFSLRQVAARCGVTPAYLSRVERGEVAPPGEETLLKLAHELGEDPDVMLAQAGKISADLRSAILARPQLFAELIRAIKSMPDHAVLRIVRDVRDGNW